MAVSNTTQHSTSVVQNLTHNKQKYLLFLYFISCSAIDTSLVLLIITGFIKWRTSAEFNYKYI